MLHIIIGVIFILALVAFLYYLKYHKNISTESKISEKKGVPEDPKKEDIVLALITGKLNLEDEEEDSYAILWNGIPNKKYNYIITNSNTEEIIAKGEIDAPSNGLAKIKDVPLVEKTPYQVHVNETSVDIYFEPPKFNLPLKISPERIECDTNIVPTGIEVLSSGQKIPLAKCQIKIDPDDPGFLCDATVEGEVTSMVYNGPNVVNIYVSIV
jgi:hypothetical protein